MALLVSFTKDNQIFSNCYARIVKTTTALSDKEMFVPADGENNIHEKSEMVKYPENYASIYIYLDEDCRKRAVPPLHAFTFRFDYDLGSPDNVFTQAYNAIKSATFFESVVDIY